MLRLLRSIYHFLSDPWRSEGEQWLREMTDRDCDASSTARLRDRMAWPSERIRTETGGDEQMTSEPMMSISTALAGDLDVILQYVETESVATYDAHEGGGYTVAEIDKLRLLAKYARPELRKALAKATQEAVRSSAPQAPNRFASPECAGVEDEQETGQTREAA